MFVFLFQKKKQTIVMRYQFLSSRGIALACQPRPGAKNTAELFFQLIVGERVFFCKSCVIS